MQLFTLPQFSALVLASTALLSTVSAGDCMPLGPKDDEIHRWTAAARLKLQPSANNNYLSYIGGNGESTFTVTVMKDGPAIRYGTMLDMKNIKLNSNAPIRQHKMLFQLNPSNAGGVLHKNPIPDPEYWLDTAGNCLSTGKPRVPMVAEDIKDIWVFVKSGR